MDRYLSDERLDRAIVDFLVDRRAEIEATAMSSYQAVSQVRDVAEPGHDAGRPMIRTSVGRPSHATRFHAMANVLKVTAVAALALAVGVTILPRSADFGAAPVPSPSPTLEPMRLREGPLPAGTYMTTPFTAAGSDACLDQADCLDLSADDSIRITFSVPDGWAGSGSDGIYLTGEGDPPTGAALIFVRGASLADDPCANDGSGDIPVGPTVDGFVDALIDHPLLDVTDPVEITLGSHAGKYLELQVPFDPTIQGSSQPTRLEGCPVYRPWEPWYLAQAPGERWLLSVLDVEGVRVVAQAIINAGTSAEDQAELRAIVDSVQFSGSPETSASAAPPSAHPKPEESVTALIDRADRVPTLGMDLPAGARSGVVDTPIGPARWVHLNDPTSVLPEELGASGARFVDVDGDRMWTSEDGMHWTSEAIDVPLVGGSWWDWSSESEWWSDNASGPDAKRLWRRSIDGAWTSIDVSDVIPAGPPAIGWELEWLSGASTEAVAAVEIDLEASQPFGTLGWSYGYSWPAEEVEPGLFSIPARGPDDPERRQRFEAVPGGLRVTDEGDGTLVTTLTGVTLEDVREWMRDGPPSGHVIAMLAGDRLVPIDTPAAIMAQRWIAMSAVADGIVALALGDPSGPAVAWRLDDTGVWTELGPWDIIEGASGGTFHVSPTDRRLIDGTEYAFFAEYHEPGTQHQIAKAWRSADGLHWDQVLESPPQESAIVRAGSGFVAMQWVGQGRALWASPDGRTWTEMHLAGLDLPSDLSSLSMTGVGDALFLVNEQEGRREWWVLGSTRSLIDKLLPWNDRSQSGLAATPLDFHRLHQTASRPPRAFDVACQKRFATRGAARLGDWPGSAGLEQRQREVARVMDAVLGG